MGLNLLENLVCLETVLQLLLLSLLLCGLRLLLLLLLLLRSRVLVDQTVAVVYVERVYNIVIVVKAISGLVELNEGSSRWWTRPFKQKAPSLEILSLKPILLLLLFQHLLFGFRR